MYKGKRTIRDIPGDTIQQKILRLEEDIKNQRDYRDRIIKEIESKQHDADRIKISADYDCLLLEQLKRKL